MTSMKTPFRHEPLNDRLQHTAEALRRSEAYLAEAQRLTHTGSWASDVTLRAVYWSEEHYRVWGLDPQQGLPTRDQFLKQIHPEDLDKVLQGLDTVLNQKVDCEAEYRIALPDGTVKHLHSIGHPVLDANEDVVEIVGTTVDITERKRAEEALRRSEAYLAEAQRITHTASWANDGTLPPRYWSEEHYRIYGLDPQQGLPTVDQLLQRIHPEDLSKMLQALETAIHQKVECEAKYRIVLPDGTVKYVHSIGHPVLNANGDVVEIVGTTVDITESKHAEQALRRSEAYLAESQKLTQTGSWAGDRSFRPSYWSEEHYRIFGLDPQRGMPSADEALDRIHPDDLSTVLQGFQTAINRGIDSEAYYRIVLPDGTVKYVHGICHPILDTKGELIELMGTTVDISERQRAEQALRESEALLRRFVDHAADAFFMLNEQGTIIDVNQSACASLGYTRDELIGNTPLAFNVTMDQGTLESVSERTAAGETVVFDRHWHQRKDGSRFPVEVHTSTFRHHGERFLLKVAQDVSDRLRAEEQRGQLRQLEADLAHINRVSIMGELTASIAHEVNQPLSGVVSNASACLRWLAGDAPNIEEARETARRIVRDGKRAAGIIAGIRALTKRAETPTEILEFNELIREVLPLVSDLAKKRSVMIRTQLADDLSTVSGERVQFQQVMLNLVMNAIEAMSAIADRPRELIITSRNTDSNQVEITVEDSGTGLAPNVSSRIFDPFYTTKPEGMGMGLSICRSIVQAHGGRLWAADKDGPGTAFHFTLPKAQEEGIDAGRART